MRYLYILLSVSILLSFNQAQAGNNEVQIVSFGLSKISRAVTTVARPIRTIASGVVAFCGHLAKGLIGHDKPLIIAPAAAPAAAPIKETSFIDVRDHITQVPLLGSTIHLCAMSGDIACVEQYLENGGDVNALDLQGRTLAHHIATLTNIFRDMHEAEIRLHTRKRMIRLLQRYCARFDIPDPKGNTVAFLLATEYPCIEFNDIVLENLTNDFDPLRRPYGFNVVQLAVLNDNTILLRRLLQDSRIDPTTAGPHNGSILFDAIFADPEVLRMILKDDRIDPAARDYYGRSALELLEYASCESPDKNAKIELLQNALEERKRRHARVHALSC